MPQGQIETFPFSPETIVQLLSDSTSVDYLVKYAAHLNASSILYERHYVDRHYLDDFVHYYARSFNAPAAFCSRIHLFALPHDDLQRHISSAYSSEETRNAAERSLQQAYLGFVVQRPLTNAPVGRTVLKTYEVDGRRHYEVVRPYNVNVGGLKLSVEGLAYQQQDGGAAVCASTALWSALQRVAYVSGNRTPTPSEITRAAGSPFPASDGLTFDRMATALSSLGYVADQMVPAENRLLFRAKLATALQSQLPVILTIYRKFKTGAGEVLAGHAVTVTGFSEPQTVVDVPTSRPDAQPVRMKGGAVDILYVHDDNLGSHAHYELFDSDDVDSEGHKKLMLRRGRAGQADTPMWQVDVWEVAAALIPKPSKQRLSIDALLHELLWLRPSIERVIAGLQLHYSMRTASGVDYKRAMFGMQLDVSELQRFMYQTSLPRHIGVLSVHHETTLLCDILLDVSEVQRLPGSPSVIGFVAPGVPSRSIVAANFSALARFFSCNLVTAPLRAAPTPAP